MDPVDNKGLKIPLTNYDNSETQKHGKQLRRSVKSNYLQRKTLKAIYMLLSSRAVCRTSGYTSEGHLLQ